MLSERIRTIDDPLRAKRLKATAICSSISRQEQKMHLSCVEDGLVLAVIGRCAPLARLGVGEGRRPMG